MKKFVISCSIMLICIIAFPSDSSTDSKALKLDIDTALTLAISHNFQLKSNNLDNKTNLIQAATSWNALLPSTSVSASLGRNISYPTFLSPPVSASDLTNTLSVGFKTSLSINAKVIFDIRQTILDYQNGKITYQIALNQLTVDTKKLYYNLVILIDQLSLENNKLDNAKRRLEASTIKYNTGVNSNVDKLQSEYDFKSIQFERKKVEDTYNSSILQLKQLIGIKTDQQILLTTSIPEITKIDYNEFIKLPVERNLTVQQKNQQLQNSQNIQNGLVASLTPTFLFSFNQSTSFNKNKDPLNDPWFNDIDNDWNRSGTLNFTISLPVDSLFPFSSMQNNIMTGQAAVLKSRYDLEDQKEKSRLSIDQAIITLKQDEEDINTLNANVDLANITFQQIERLYNVGSKSFLELKDAENNLYDAKFKLLSAQYSYLSNMIDLKNLLNIEDKKGASNEK